MVRGLAILILAAMVAAPAAATPYGKPPMKPIAHAPPQPPRAALEGTRHFLDLKNAMKNRPKAEATAKSSPPAKPAAPKR